MPRIYGFLKRGSRRLGNKNITFYSDSAPLAKTKSFFLPRGFFITTLAANATYNISVSRYNVASPKTVRLVNTLTKRDIKVS